MKAKGTWIIVCRRPIPSEHKLESGIILPQSLHDDDMFEGVIHSVGDYLEDLKVNPGDYVLMRNSGNKIKVGAVKAGELFAMEYDDLLCVLNEEDDEEDF